VSIFDVAKAAGVSRATAARALGGYGSVSAQSEERVLAAAEQLGYSINSVARSMVTGQTMTIGALIADVSNPFFARVIRGITDGARSTGYDVLLVNTDESVEAEAHGLRVLIEKRVDGMVIAPASQIDYAHLASALNRGQVIVQVDRFIPELDTDRIVVDNYQASYRAVRRLIEAGHHLIAAPRYDDDLGKGRVRPISTMEERHQGYRNAMADAGLSIPEHYTPNSHDREPVRVNMTKLLRSSDRPTAVFGLDNSFTLGIIDAINAAELHLGRDLSVLGFDDTEWSTVIRPPLSVIAQPAYELGERAAMALVDRLRHPDAPRQTTVLSTTWIERGSIGPPA